MSIKNRSYYLINNVIALKDFDEANLKVNKKYYKHIYIYYIGYTAIKRICDYENIRIVNPLYSIIHSGAGYFTEENNNKYLILDSTNKYEEVWSEVRVETKELLMGNNFFMKKTILELNLILMMIYHLTKY